jgi:hypothetical protein
MERHISKKYAFDVSLSGARRRSGGRRSSVWTFGSSSGLVVLLSFSLLSRSHATSATGLRVFREHPTMAAATTEIVSGGVVNASWTYNATLAYRFFFRITLQLSTLLVLASFSFSCTRPAAGRSQLNDVAPEQNWFVFYVAYASSTKFPLCFSLAFLSPIATANTRYRLSNRNRLSFFPVLACHADATGAQNRLFLSVKTNSENASRVIASAFADTDGATVNERPFFSPRFFADVVGVVVIVALGYLACFREHA